MPIPQYANLPFTEANAFFRDKLNLDTAAYTDIWQGMHSRAFVIAGATRDDVLTDIRAAVESAIAEGTTLEQFRQAFDTTVQKHGWAYKGGRGWRTRVIYAPGLQRWPRETVASKSAPLFSLRSRRQPKPP